MSNDSFVAHLAPILNFRPIFSGSQNGSSLRLGAPPCRPWLLRWVLPRPLPNLALARPWTGGDLHYWRCPGMVEISKASFLTWHNGAANLARRATTAQFYRQDALLARTAACPRVASGAGSTFCLQNCAVMASRVRLAPLVSGYRGGFGNGH